MKIGVCLKQVPATDTAIKVNADATGIVTDDVKWIVNPYDEYALEAALQLKDAGKASEVVVLTMGGADADARIKDGLARGAGGAVRLDDPAFAEQRRAHPTRRGLVDSMDDDRGRTLAGRTDDARGEIEVERASGAFLGLHPDSPVQAVDDGLGDG